ncbi:MAG: PepSY domain-containing protein [Rhodobacteraceae bacterium]|nr:PepSY domain-containing protein [Paracoccaceae bacterium]
MKLNKPLTLTALILAIPAMAFAGITVGDRIGTSETEIRTQIEALGYDVQEIEFEGGEIEVEVLKDGVETELVLNPANGTVREIEQDDD